MNDNGTPDRATLVAELARLNQEVRQFGGTPSFDPEVEGQLFSRDELQRAVLFTARDLLALREAG